jgi:hypothetical protein
MTEQNLATCRACQQNKIKILQGKYPSGNKKYSNESGKLWSGSTCPECNTPRIKAAMQKSRLKYKKI